MDTMTEMHKRVAIIMEQYGSLTNEELVRARDEMQDTYLYSLSYTDGIEEAREHRQIMDQLTAIATLLYERAEKG